MSRNVKVKLYPVDYLGQNLQYVPGLPTWMSTCRQFAVETARTTEKLSEQDFCFFAGRSGIEYIRTLEPGGSIIHYKVVTSPIEMLLEIDPKDFKDANSQSREVSVQEPATPVEVSEPVALVVPDEPVSAPTKVNKETLTTMVLARLAAMPKAARAECMGNFCQYHEANLSCTKVVGTDNQTYEFYQRVGSEVPAEVLSTIGRPFTRGEWITPPGDSGVGSGFELLRRGKVAKKKQP